MSLVFFTDCCQLLEQIININYLLSWKEKSMEKKETSTIEVVAKDFYGENCIVDSAMSRRNKKRRPEGMVEIYDVTDKTNRKLVRKNNLVLYQGRETLAQMLVRVNTIDSSGQPPLQPVAGNKDHFLCWFGLGQGAADTECSPGSGDVFAPEPPTNEDTELSCPIMINVSDASSADYHIINDPGYPGGDCQGTGGLYPATGFYKHPFGEITFEEDSLNDNRWIVIRISTTMGVDDANGSTMGGQPLNEAGLYTAASNVPNYGYQDNTKFALFARVTFPTLLKNSTRRLQFVWYLFI